MRYLRKPIARWKPDVRVGSCQEMDYPFGQQSFGRDWRESRGIKPKVGIALLVRMGYPYKAVVFGSKGSLIVSFDVARRARSHGTIEMHFEKWAQTFPGHCTHRRSMHNRRDHNQLSRLHLLAGFLDQLAPYGLPVCEAVPITTLKSGSKVFPVNQHDVLYPELLQTGDQRAGQGGLARRRQSGQQYGGGGPDVRGVWIFLHLRFPIQARVVYGTRTVSWYSCATSSSIAATIARNRLPA